MLNCYYPWNDKIIINIQVYIMNINKLNTTFSIVIDTYSNYTIITKN